MALTPASFLYEHDQQTSVATITLNRPDRLNAISGEMLTRLSELFLELDHDADVRAMILTGAGRAFSAGANMGGPGVELDGAT